MHNIKILGCDPSFSNWGAAQGIYDARTNKLTIVGLDVIRPVVSKSKTIRQNSLDLQRSKHLAKGMIDLTRWADAIAVEVPHGSQSARAMASYGVCIGILGVIANTKVPMIEVNANETRQVITGKREATKAQAIAWAMEKHPEAPWPKHRGEINAGLAEHMADAIAAIYAAMQTDTFKTMAMLASKE